MDKELIWHHWNQKYESEWRQALKVGDRVDVKFVEETGEF